MDSRIGELCLFLRSRSPFSHRRTFSISLSSRYMYIYMLGRYIGARRYRFGVSAIHFICICLSFALSARNKSPNKIALISVFLPARAGRHRGASASKINVAVVKIERKIFSRTQSGCMRSFNIELRGGLGIKFFRKSDGIHIYISDARSKSVK